jgi:hypothetical protein
MHFGSSLKKIKLGMVRLRYSRLVSSIADTWAHHALRILQLCPLVRPEEDLVWVLVRLRYGRLVSR